MIIVDLMRGENKDLWHLEDEWVYAMEALKGRDNQ